MRVIPQNPLLVLLSNHGALSWSSEQMHQVNVLVLVCRSARCASLRCVASRSDCDWWHFLLQRSLLDRGGVRVFVWLGFVTACSYVLCDCNVGLQLLDILDETGAAAHTIVTHIGDHGEH